MFKHTTKWCWLTHWGRVTHICVGKLTIIGSDNGLSPERRQAIVWTNAGILLIGPLATNFKEILIEIQTFSLKKIRLKMSSAKCCSFRLGLNVLTTIMCRIHYAVRQRRFVIRKFQRCTGITGVFFDIFFSIAISDATLVTNIWNEWRAIKTSQIQSNHHIDRKILDIKAK